ncbi:MAG TPA: hypothetical protein VMD55_07990 [Terracidiphilus sp.]|nr:hypothetical protein [Terracidiphilus sp.]
MQIFFGGRSIIRLALVLTLLAMVPAAQAQSGANLNKHERKIHKRLLHYAQGTYVKVELRDGTERDGLLGAVAPASFILTDSDSNAEETHAYNDVARVSRSREYIGEGSESGHHFRPWVPVVVGAVAAGAVVTAFEVR